ncbi:MAG: FRG domain-containing protein [Opitutales bacterium]|nr:FRG domain-containing protein [Opitutales bacterium]
MLNMFPEFGIMTYPPHAADTLTFDSLGDLFDLGIRNFKADGKARYFFRGECAFFPEPMPSIFRSEKLLENEHKIFQDALNRVPELFENCPTTFDKLCQMQHYGFPTRLLDISPDLAMAWFMAIDGWNAKELLENINNPRGGVFYIPNILVIRVPLEREKFVDSDLVSTLANVARMKPRFNSGHLRHEVAQERNDFSEDFFLKNVREECSRNRMVYPRMSNPRVARQKGAFILSGLTEDNCHLLARGQGATADKMQEGASTGLCFPKIEWDLQRRSSEISICSRLVPSRKYLKNVSDAIFAGTQTYRDVARIQCAVENFKRKIFEELAFVGNGESDAYADDYVRQASVCRRYFEE